MPQKLTLTTPQVTETTVNNYEVVFLSLSKREQQVRCAVEDDLGKILRFMYEGDVAQTMMRNLNTANLSVKSLEERIIERAVLDGKLPPGTVTGVPDV